MSNASLATTRYISPIPENITIANTKPQLAEMQHANIGALLFPENGGYYLKHPEGKVVAVASDRLCSILDDSHMSLYFHLEMEGEHEDAAGVLEDLRKAGIDADKLKREASDAIRHGACVVDPGVGCEGGDDDQQIKDGKDEKDEL